jgi:hypothetical protein
MDDDDELIEIRPDFQMNNANDLNLFRDNSKDSGSSFQENNYNEQFLENV